MRLVEVARFCADVDWTAAFYQTVLGAPPASQHPGRTATFLLGGVKLFLHQRALAHDPGWPLRDEDHIAFAVVDVDRACADLAAAGLVIEVGPQDFPWGRSAYLRDPDGRLVELHRPQTAGPAVLR
jgi:catechol 2,3-dioxygenase-like lactoylglutathione lyase family enzyme